MESKYLESIIDSLVVGHELIVTTSEDVYSWSTAGRKRLFHSKTKGILASKRTSTLGGLLAISDGYGMLLHNPETVTVRDYKLRASKGRAHPLHFDEPSQRLFFLTSKHRSVQCFSTARFILLPPPAQHPSAPLVFAFSAALNIILSASINPSLVMLTNLRNNGSPLVVDTKCSRTPVASATFQAHPGTVFALGFIDGTVAIYDVLSATGEIAADFLGDHPKVKERGHLIRLHACPPISSSGSSNLNEGSSIASAPRARSGTGGKISLAFAPSASNLLITTGPDGRCTVVEIGSSVHIRNHWSVGAPASSLALITTPDANDGPNLIPPGTLIIAVGRVDGVLTFFNLDGHSLVDVALNDPYPVIGVDFVPLRFSAVAPDPKQIKAAESSKASHVVNVMNAEQQDLSNLHMLDRGTAETPIEVEVNELADYASSHSPAKTQYFTPQNSPTKQEMNPYAKPRELHPNSGPCLPTENHSRKPFNVHWSSRSSHKSYRSKHPKIPPRHSSSKSSSRSSANVVGITDQASLTPNPWSRSRTIQAERQGHEDVQASRVQLPGNLYTDTSRTTAKKCLYDGHSDAAASITTSSISTASNEAVPTWDGQLDSTGMHHSPPSQHPASAQYHPSGYSHLPSTVSTRSPKVDSASEMRPAPLSFQVPPKLIRRPQTVPVLDADKRDQRGHTTDFLEPASPVEPANPLIERESKSAQTEAPHTVPLRPNMDATNTTYDAAKLMQELVSLREELRTLFTDQREWFDGLLKEQLGKRLLELNQRSRILKLELFRLKDKEKETNAQGTAEHTT